MNAYAGYIIISRRSEYPLSLYLHNCKVVIKDAMHMLGFIANEVVKGPYAGLKLDAFEANTLFTMPQKMFVDESIKSRRHKGERLDASK